MNLKFPWGHSGEPLAPSAPCLGTQSAEGNAQQSHLWALSTISVARTERVTVQSTVRCKVLTYCVQLLMGVVMPQRLQKTEGDPLRRTCSFYILSATCFLRFGTRYWCDVTLFVCCLLVTSVCFCACPKTCVAALA